MKTIAPTAMAAIEAGEAIVTGAVEIRPPGVIDYSTVGVIDLSALTDSGLSASAGMSAGITVGGFSPSDIVRVSLPSGQAYTAWSGETPIEYWVNNFSVIPDAVVANVFTVSSTGVTPGHASGGAPFATAEAARAAFGTKTFTGASSYTFYISDTFTLVDNHGGLSVLVERGVSSGGPIRVWGGHGPISIDGNEFLGIGAHGLAQQTAGAIGGIAQGLKLSLSGLEPAVLELLDSDEIKNAPVVVYRMIFASDGKSLLDAHVFDRGRVDTVDTDETIGGEASINVAVEGAARGLGRSGARRRADSDQRLVDASDGYFKHTAFAGEKTLYWGGKRPKYGG